MKRAVLFRLVVEKCRPARTIVTVLMLSIAVHGPAKGADGPLFAAPFLSFDTGTAPYCVAIGDLNGDGKPDLVTANYGYNTGFGSGVSVLLGNGDGTFGPKTDYFTPNAPWSVAIGDLNGDGRPDLAVANHGNNQASGNTVSVLLGNGDGTFGDGAEFLTGSRPTSVAIGDLNGDGKPDLATANEGNTAWVLLGNGDGSFRTPTRYFTGNAPRCVAIGDLNGDDRPDLATANSASSTVSVLLGNGDGTFGTKTDFGTWRSPYSVAIGDLNGDGKPDLATADYSSGGVSVLLGNGDGSFRTRMGYATGGAPYSVAIGDLNGDGRPDLATATYGAKVSVLLGNGDGSFPAPKLYWTGASSYSVAIGDLNGDGKLDLAATTLSPGAVSVLLGNGDGSFPAQRDYGTGNSPSAVAVGDLNGDGKPDLVTGNDGANTVSVLLGNGDGSFGANADFSTGSAPQSVAIGDLNGDGRPDLATANPGANTVSVLLGNGDGSFGASTDFGTGNSPYSVAIGDLNGDGRPDLATANLGSNTVSVLLGNGDGSFAASTDFGTGTTPRSVAIGDLNGDGKPDLVTADSPWSANGTTSVLLGNGDGSFKASIQYGVGYHPTSVAIGDLNGDGKPDLATANENGTLSVLLGSGDGTFGPQVEYFSMQGSFRSVVIADLNGDGRPDLATLNLTYMVTVLLGNGDGTFDLLTMTNYGAGINPGAVMVGDLNGDCMPDLVTANRGASTVSVLLNIGTPPTHTILASAGAHGSIDPAGPVAVAHCASQTFTITPDAHCHVADVVVDGASVGVATSHAFSHVIADHTIAASFAFDTYALSVNVVGSGTVTRSPDLPRYDYGTTVLLSAAPAPGWVFSGWSGDASGPDPTVSVLMDRDRTVTATFCVQVTFDFKPHDLHLKSKDKWVTGFIKPPAPYLASQIDVASIRLNGAVAVSPEHPAKLEDHDAKLKVKFARSEVMPTLTPGDHVPVTVSGTIAGVCFMGTDYIKVKAPKIHHPAAGDVLAAGTTIAVTWETPEGPPAQSVTLLSSFDDGVTWAVETVGLPNTGSCAWTVPNVATSQARLQVMLIYDTDETGVIPESEFAVSDAFSIGAPTGVGGEQATFALRPANPIVGPVTVRFSLASGAPASLAVFDISGRQVISREVGSGGAGWHTAKLGDLPAGAYVVRLSQGGRSLSSRVAVIR